MKFSLNFQTIWDEVEFLKIRKRAGIRFRNEQTKEEPFGTFHNWKVREYLGIIKRFFSKNPRSEKKKHEDIEESESISLVPRHEIYWGTDSDIVFEVETFEIGEYGEDKFTEVSHTLIAGPRASIVEHHKSTVSDHIDRDREKHGDHRRGKTRKKEDHREECEELEHDTQDRWEKESIEWKSLKWKKSIKECRLKCYHEHHHARKSEKFPEKNRWTRDGFGEHEEDRTTLDLTGDHTSSEKEDDSESSELDKWESEIIENPFEFSESERLESKWKRDKHHPEKKDQGEKFISDKFADSIVSDGKHS